MHADFIAYESPDLANSRMLSLQSVSVVTENTNAGLWISCKPKRGGVSILELLMVMAPVTLAAGLTCTLVLGPCALTTQFPAVFANSQHVFEQYQGMVSTMLQEAAPAGGEPTSEAVLRRTFALAAQYILLSFVLQPAKEVYSKSLQVIKQLLPLPYLRAGRLLAVASESLDAVPERWTVSMFVVDQAGFRTVAPHDPPAAPSQQATAELQEANGLEESQQAQRQSGSGDRQQANSYQMELSDIACVKPCNDPSLPPGYAFWVSLHARTQGLYFIAEVSEDAEGWVDALHMASYAAKQGRMQMLASALALASGEQQYHSDLP